MTAAEGDIGTSVETEVVFAYEGKTIWQRYNKGQSRQRDNYKCNQISDTLVLKNSRFLIRRFRKIVE